MENSGEFQTYSQSDVAGWPVRTFDSIDSTNRYLMDAARAGNDFDRLVAVARHQTAGRGRRGRVWDDKPGASLLLSILFASPSVAPVTYGQAVALSVTDACSLVAGVKATLKWPNDVLIEGRKVAGILTETSTDIKAVVVGCGINLNWAGELPESLRPTAISLDEAAGAAIPEPEFLSALLSAISARLGRPNWVTHSYRSRCATLGQQVLVQGSDGNLKGTAVDLTDDGALVVETDGVRQVVAVGDVVHLRTV